MPESNAIKANGILKVEKGEYCISHLPIGFTIFPFSLARKQLSMGYANWEKEQPTEKVNKII